MGQNTDIANGGGHGWSTYLWGCLAFLVLLSSVSYAINIPIGYGDNFIPAYKTISEKTNSKYIVDLIPNMINHQMWFEVIVLTLAGLVPAVFTYYLAHVLDIPGVPFFAKIIVYFLGYIFIALPLTLKFLGVI